MRKPNADEEARLTAEKGKESAEKRGGGLEGQKAVREYDYVNWILYVEIHGRISKRGCRRALLECLALEGLIDEIGENVSNKGQIGPVTSGRGR